jgi:hypothetical protein
LQVRLLRDIVSDAVPVECRLTADVQALDATLEQSQARVQIQRRVGSRESRTPERCLFRVKKQKAR